MKKSGKIIYFNGRFGMIKEKDDKKSYDFHVSDFSNKEDANKNLEDQDVEFRAEFLAYNINRAKNIKVLKK